jgi:UDPglucose 6-dehydrogenase
VVGSRFSATTDLEGAVADTTVTLIAVGTPFGEDRIDLAQIEGAAEEIGRALAGLDRYHVVAVKSTVVPGTTEDVVGPALARSSGRRLGSDIGLGMNPEFLREGVAVQDFLNPDRLVLGGIDDHTLTVLDELYAVYDDVPVLRVDPRTAEMIKYTNNALLALLISFSNEIGNLSASLGCDVTEVLEGVHLDHRWTPAVDGQRIRPAILTYLAAGCGFGGSCFPKDVKALLAHGRSQQLPMHLLEATIVVNEAQPSRLIELLGRHLDPAGAKVTVLGAAFKPGTDDVRESPTLRTVPELRAAGANITVHDPIALDNLRDALGDDQVCLEPDLQRALAGADAVVLVTAWPDYAALPELLAGRRVPVIDGRRMLTADEIEVYDGIGYPWRHDH